MNRDSRAFALAAESPDPALLWLLRAAEADDLDREAATEAARLAQLGLRAAFPAGVRAERAFRTSQGLEFVIDASDRFAASAYLGHLQGGADFAAFMALIEPGDLIIDVGANFGVYALQAAHHAGPDGHVLAIEPAPPAFELLRANIEQNRCGARISARAAAAARAPGSAAFHVAQDSSFSGLHQTGRAAPAGVVTVEVTTLDRELAAPAQAALLKIDVEGREGDVLLGALALIARSPRLIIQFECSYKNLSGADYEALDEAVAALAALGFTLFAPRGAALAPLTEAPRARERFSGNLYLAREGDAARLAAAHAAAPRPASTAGTVAVLNELRGRRRALEHAASLDATIEEVGGALLGAEGAGEPLARVRALQSALEQARRRAGEAEALLQRREATHAEELLQLRAKLGRHREALAAFEANAMRAAADRVTLDADMARWRGEVARLLAQLGDARAAQEAAEAELAVRRDAAAAQGAHLAALEAKLASHRAGHDGALARLAALAAERDGAADKANRYRAAHDRLAARLAEVNQQRDAAHAGETAALRAAIESAHARIATLERDCETLGAKAAMYKQAHDRLNERLIAAAAAEQGADAAAEQGADDVPH